MKPQIDVHCQFENGKVLGVVVTVYNKKYEASRLIPLTLLEAAHTVDPLVQTKQALIKKLKAYG